MSRISFLFFIFLVYAPCYAQFSNLDVIGLEGLTVGLEKNNSLWADYGFRNGIHVNFKHTVYADKLSKQSWRVSVLYSKDFKIIQTAATAFVTSDWQTSFHNIGCSLRLRNLWKEDIVKIGVEYIPYYDNDLKFQNGWSAGTQIRLYKQISFLAEYGRKPDYRIAYKRMYLGFDFSELNLCVRPMLEIPFYDSGLQWNHSKVVVSMFYNFH